VSSAPGRTGRDATAIIGGGMLGLTLALRLARAGHAVTVFEAAPTLGGLASAWRIGGVTWDRFYHVIAPDDDALVALLEELGLAGEIRWSETRTRFFAKGRHYPLNSSLDFARLPVLGLVDKARLALNIVYGASIRDGTRLETLDAETWLVRWSGRRTYERLWRPLLRAKLGANHRHASAAYIWSVIRRFYGARRGSMKKECFGYVDGGYARVLETLAARLGAEGVVLATGGRVTGVHTGGAGFEVAVEGAGSSAFDRVVLTCPSPLIARLVPALPAPERARHDALRYQGIVCVSLVTKVPLGGAYLTYITDESIPFTTVIEMSSLVDLGDRHLVYLPKYVPADDPVLAVDDETIIAEFVAHLTRMYPALAPEDIVEARVARTRHVMAIATLGYSDVLPPMVSTLRGLYAVNSAQIVNAALSVNETVTLANRAAEIIASEASA